jgi:hypothetical protein
MPRFFRLIPLQCPALLAPAIISALGYPDLTGRIGNALTLRDQHVNLLQLRGNLFRLVSLLCHRLFYDCAGWAGPDYAAERGAEWVRVGLAELPFSQVVFATDYPQAVRHDDEASPTAPASPFLARTRGALRNVGKFTVAEGRLLSPTLPAAARAPRAAKSPHRRAA